MRSTSATLLFVVSGVCLALGFNARAEPIGTAFTYQGQLKEAGVPADGFYDLEFTLYDSETDGSALAGSIVFAGHLVSNGLFTVALDFEADIFKGEACWLEIGVRHEGDTGPYTYLSPRQKITPAPYALALPGLRTQQNADCPNVIGGHRENTIGAGVHGATIGGGGSAGTPNSVTGSFGAVGGGQQNTVLNRWATVAGGISNIAGTTEPSGRGPGGAGAFVGGGAANQASGQSSVVPGGENNVAGGRFSFAAGRSAKALHDGTFVWRDFSEPSGPFESTGENQFLINAAGGVGIGTNTPEGVLDVRGPNGGDIHVGVNDVGARIISTDAAGNLNLRPRVDGAGVFVRDGNTNKGIRLYGGGMNVMQSVDLDGSSPFALAINPHGGNVGIGTATPGARLDVGAGDIHLDANRELFFSDNGQIRSANDKHRILFRRDENRLELREYGTIIFSAGATAGDETASVVVRPSGNLGIGTLDPLTRQHIKGSHLSLPAVAFMNEDLAIEDADAVLGLYSNIGGDWGSALSLGEIDAGGNLADKWTLARRTSNSPGGSALRLTYGPDANYATNTTIMHFAPSGRVGIGTDDPDTVLHVRQGASPVGISAGTFECFNENGAGVVGHGIAAAATGVRGVTESDEGAGVHGVNNSTEGDTVGVLGEIGVAAELYSLAAGVRGRTAAGLSRGFGVVGIQGPDPDLDNRPATGAGVYGYGRVYGVIGHSGDGASNVGVSGITQCATGAGVAGVADTLEGGNHGGSFLSHSAGGYGVHAETASTNVIVPEGPAGLLAEGGTAIRGLSSVSGGNGVVGVANGFNSWGVYGESDIGYAGRFEGEVLVNGDFNVTGGDKHFLIDHPLDPANKYLAHSCVESDERLNTYTGNATLDAAGEAWVQLPAWFEEINTNFRYQLTCIGGFARVYIAQEVKDGQFKIAGGRANMKISWTVTAVRNDPYARNAAFVVERDKPEHERGYYLQPELYGHGKEKGMIAAKAALSERLQSDPEVIAEQERLRAEMKKRCPMAVRRQDTVPEPAGANSDATGG
ncbi:MAG: hypothetical protein JSU86_15775 [Phycisphaerales bacterium]|nr:MAG: hypothetical protein JSU86_15775 [Phycisphaerales bacterium]